jgi:methionine-rich copper-binding protein CopC
MSSLQGKISSGGLVNADEVCMNAVGNGPFIAKADPVSYSTQVPVNKVMTLNFQENVQASQAFSAIQLRCGTITIPCNTVIDGNSLLITPESLATDTSYTLFIPANAVKNVSGEGMKLPYNLSFTTVDTINPTITGTTPVDGATNEPVYNTVYINFSEDIKAGPNLVKTTFNGVAIDNGTFGYSINKNVLRMNYYGNLLYNTKYKIMIPEGAVTDQVGNPLNTAYSFGFTTIADNVPPTVSYTQPFNDSVGVAANAPVMVYFNEFIKEGAEIGNVTLSNGSTVIPSVKYISSKSLQIIPQNGATLEKNTKYTVNIPAGAVVDMAENRFAAAYTFSFTTSPFQVAELPIHVTDAVMDPTNPIIYMISKYDGKLCTVNTETGTTYTVALPYAPQSIDIGKDQFADKLYIGLYGPIYTQGQEQADPSSSIAVYDKNTLTLEKSMPITINPYDLVAGRDGYVYVTSATDQWTTIESYSMLTNSKCGSSGIRQMSYAKLHPTLNKIYTINTDVSPRDLSAYNISNGTFTDPVYPGGYDSPYHGDYALSEYFAIDPTGKYLFNGSGNIFQTTADKSTDMVYKGKVDAAFTAIAFDEDMNRFYTSAATATATAPTTVNTSAVNVYNGSDFSLSQTLPTAGTGNFIFKQGGKLLVLLQIAGSKNTGLQILDIPAKKLIVKSTNPVNFAVNVDKNSDVVVTFDDTISASSAYDRISMTDYNQKPLIITKQTSGNQLIIKCDNMAYNTKYYLNLPVDCVKSSTGIGLDSYFGISFTTEQEPDTLPPDIKSTYPMDGGTGTKIADELYVNYTELIAAGSSYEGINLKDANNNAIAISKRINGNSLIITAASVLNYDTKYILTVPAGAIMDGSKNATIAEKTISFTTEPKPDTTPPVILGTDPMNGATGIAINKIIKVNFSENIAEANSSAQILWKDSNGNSVVFSKTISGNTLTITPLAVLNYETNYTVSIPAGSIKDLAGNLLGVAGSISFVTQLKPDTIAPVMLTADPVNGALDIAVNKVISLNFSENILEGSTTVPISLKDSYGNSVGFNKAINGSTLTITPLSSYNYSTKYTIIIPAGALKDVAGNLLASPIATSFTTQAKPDVTAPVVLSTSPAKYATNVPLSTTIRINYDENITVAAVDLAKITLKKGSTIIKVTVQISGKTLIITPATMLSRSSTYTVSIPAGLVKDSSNNAATALTFTFTTAKR